MTAPRRPKHFRALRTAVLGGIFSALFVQQASADNTWDGGGADALWSNALNWGADTTPTLPGALTFGGTLGLTSTNKNLRMIAEGSNYYRLSNEAEAIFFSFQMDTGNVGIGTTTPAQTLDVNGNIKGTQLCIGADCRSAWPGSGGGGTLHDPHDRSRAARCKQGCLACSKLKATIEALRSAMIGCSPTRGRPHEVRPHADRDRVA